MVLRQPASREGRATKLSKKAVDQSNRRVISVRLQVTTEGRKKQDTAKTAQVLPVYPISLRGKLFTKAQVDLICECVSKFFKYGRTRISVEVCKKLRWKQPNGWLKDRACRDVLVRLEKMGVIKLPDARRGNHNPDFNSSSIQKSRFKYKQIVFPKDITLEFAKGNKAEKTWNELVAKHHYLGHKIVVGRCIKYLIRHRDQIVGAISFSSAAWKLAPRDNRLKALGFSRARIRNSVISNNRFLILAENSEPNLASRILSAATRQVAHDWNEFYSIKPQFVETFVQPSRFKGTCYKAANWHKLGYTKGFAKKGREHVNSQEPKQIFIYGLTAETRRKLAAKPKHNGKESESKMSDPHNFK